MSCREVQCVSTDPSHAKTMGAGPHHFPLRGINHGWGGGIFYVVRLGETQVGQPVCLMVREIIQTVTETGSVL